GEISLRDKKFEEAVEQLNKAATMNPLDLRAQDLWAIANRKSGRHKEALTQIEKVLRFDPLDYLALHEHYLIQLELKNAAGAGKAKDRLLEVFSRDDEFYLEDMKDYHITGLIDEYNVLLHLC